MKRPFGVLETLFSSSKSLVKILRLFELKRRHDDTETSFDFIVTFYFCLF